MFWADMLFATISACIALTLPLIVRYVTSTLIYLPAEEIVRQITIIGIALVVLIGLDFYCKFFIGNLCRCHRNRDVLQFQLCPRERIEHRHESGRDLARAAFDGKFRFHFHKFIGRVHFRPFVFEERESHSDIVIEVHPGRKKVLCL